MNAKEAKQIISDNITSFNVKHLVRIVGQRGTADAIEIKEKKPETVHDSVALDNFLSACENRGLQYKGIGVGFDYNANEYTMIFKY